MNVLDNTERIVKYLRSNGARRIGLFGSFARGDNSSHSDIDLLVKFAKTPSLIKLCQFERELSEMLSHKVDLVTENSVSVYMIDSIRKEEKVIYE